MFKKVGCVVAIVAVLVLGANDGAWAENLIVNGGFENGAGGEYGGTADNWDGAYWGRFDSESPTDDWGVYDGQYSLHLGGEADNGIYQGFTAVPGQSYQVDFQASGFALESFIDPQYVVVRVTGLNTGESDLDESVATPRGSDPATDLGWTPHSRLFQASDTDMVLSFSTQLDVGGMNAITLDNVSVSVVPEPGTLLLLLSGLLGLLIWRQRK